MYTELRNGFTQVVKRSHPALPTYRGLERNLAPSGRMQTGKHAKLTHDITGFLERCGTLYTSLHQMEMAPLLGLTLSDTQALTLIAQTQSLTTGAFRRIMGLSSGGAAA